MNGTTETQEGTVGTVNKKAWIESLCTKKRQSGYTENEVAAYRYQMENKYARFSEAEFAKAMAKKEARSR